MKGGEEESNYYLVYFFASINASLCLCFYCFCLRLQYSLSLFYSLYIQYVCVYLNAFVAFSLVLLDVEHVLSTSHLCPSRIVPRCIYFVYFALVV